MENSGETVYTIHTEFSEYETENQHTANVHARHGFRVTARVES